MESQKYKIDFITIPAEILYDKNLTDKEKMLLGLIQNLPKGLRMANADIAEALCCSTRTVTTLISALIAKGYASGEGRGGKFRHIKVEKSRQTTSKSDDITWKSNDTTSKSDDITWKPASTTTKKNTTEDKRTSTVDDEISQSLKAIFKKGYPQVLGLTGGDVTLLNDAVEYARAHATGSLSGYARRLLENGWRPDAETPAEIRDAEKKEKVEEAEMRRLEKERQYTRESMSGWIKEADVSRLRKQLDNPRLAWLIKELRPEVLPEAVAC